MDFRKSAIAGLIAMLAAFVLFWLMDMNFCGWLGAWFTPGAAWFVGVAMAAGFAVLFAALWAGPVAKQPFVKKMSPVIAATLYGVVVGLLFIFIVPLLFAAMAGNPGMVHGDGFAEVFGAHAVPELPGLGFRPPLASWVDDDWIERDAFVARLLPFTLAFALYGLVLGLISQKGK